MDDILIEGLVRLLFGRSLSGDLDAQRSWRIYTSLTFVLILVATVWLPVRSQYRLGGPIALLGFLVALWNVVFGLVDSAKELPQMPWRGVVAMIASIALLVIAGRVLTTLVLSVV